MENSEAFTKVLPHWSWSKNSVVKSTYCSLVDLGLILAPMSGDSKWYVT